jgi:hypothetical protein
LNDVVQLLLDIFVFADFAAVPDDLRTLILASSAVWYVVANYWCFVVPGSRSFTQARHSFAVAPSVGQKFKSRAQLRVFLVPPRLAVRNSICFYISTGMIGSGAGIVAELTGVCMVPSCRCWWFCFAALAGPDSVSLTVVQPWLCYGFKPHRSPALSSGPPATAAAAAAAAAAVVTGSIAGDRGDGGRR